jgi:uncharacterized protein (TIGR02266 family)
MYVGMLIKRLGYNIFLAQDADETIKLAREKNPSVIVLDYKLPKIDDSSCLSLLKKDSKLRNIPVIILSSDVNELVREEFMNSDSCYVLGKPVNISEFYTAIQGCLKQADKALNKRRNIRSPLSLKVSIECGNESQELFATNLSHEGMFLRTISPFEVGTEMDAFFTIDDEDPIELKGQVVYIKGLSGEMDSEPGMGIKFLDVPEDIKYRIAFFVMEQIAHDLIAEGKNINNELGYNGS